MPPNPNKQQQHKEDRRIFWGLVAGSGLVAAIVWAIFYGRAYIAYTQYAPQEGDILFQSLPKSRLVNAIEGVTQSRFSHCGIVAKVDGSWIVYEAYRNVEATPLKEFLFRGRNHGFSVYRLTNQNQKHVQLTIQRVKSFVGRPYDSRYRMDDENIYCSELVYKAYLSASGNQLGRPVCVRDLNWKPWRETIEYYEKGPVPMNREIITPKAIAEDDQVNCVFTYNMAAAGAMTK